jgi:regulator of sirC expression with transglutaminase-like and TPR domain
MSEREQNPTTPAPKGQADRADRALATLALLGDYPPDTGFDIAAAGLGLSRASRPELDLAPYYASMDILAEEVRVLTAGGVPPAEALRHVLFDDQGFQGDRDTYDDLDNADLARVIDRRRGLPVALGILWIATARAQGWRAEGLDLPNHFLIRVNSATTGTTTGTSDGDSLNRGAGRSRDQGKILDPFHGGRELDAYDIEMLTHRAGGGVATARIHGGEIPRPRAVSDRGVLLRLQNNIKLRQFQAEDVEGGLTTLSSMRRLAPELASLALEQATVLVQAGAMRRAHDLLSQYLEAGHGDPDERHDMDRFLSALRSTLN